MVFFSQIHKYSFTDFLYTSKCKQKETKKRRYPGYESARKEGVTCWNLEEIIRKKFWKKIEQWKTEQKEKMAKKRVVL